jgi:alanyl-tRNA synthetase
VAFKLYDTYGFPLDLTQDVLRGRGQSVDSAGFEAAMAEQRRKAREAWAGTGEAATERLWFELKEQLGATEFFGYSTERAEGVVQALVVGDGTAAEAAAGTEVQVIVNQTPFYGESGGQVGDTGIILGSGGAEVTVRDTQKKLGALFVHLGTVTKGTLKVGEAVELRVDGTRRSAIRANHSATHLLHAALRRRLGDHVTQKGSMVSAERLRFDISHPMALSPADIAVVEAEVNQRVLGNSEVVTRLMSPEEAQKDGAMALFGEKYGEEVRVVSMGGRDDPTLRDYSVELCGGTHARRTGDIGVFKIVTEAAVAAGVRRIEGVTGTGAVAWLNDRDRLLNEAAAAIHAAPAELPARVKGLVEERRKLERELADLRRQMAMGGGGGAGGGIREVGGTRFAARVAEGLAAKDLKGMADELKKQVGSGVVAVIALNDGKASLVVGVTDDLTKRLSAVDLVKAGAAALGGKGGGGRPDLAQAGGPDGAQAQAAVAAIEAVVAALA